MSEKTKSCNLNEAEIRTLIFHHGSQSLYGEMDEAIDRINYLNKRLKTFNEVETVKPVDVPAPQEKVGW